MGIFEDYTNYIKYIKYQILPPIEEAIKIKEQNNLIKRVTLGISNNVNL